MTVQENAVYGKVPYFIHVCREGKSERMSCRLITPKKKFDNFNGTIAGAGLDVQETEPPEENSPLYTMDNVLLTPHMGWKGLETRQRLVSILADNIKKFIEGNPINVVSGL